MGDVFEQISLHGPHHNVDVVGHDDVMTEDVTLAIKVTQRSFHDGGNFRPSQHTFTHARVKPALKPLREPLMKLGFLRR